MMLSGVGKLYSIYDGQAVATVDYRLYLELSPEGHLSGWSGELVLSDSRRIRDGDGYIIELDDERKGRCSLRKKDLRQELLPSCGKRQTGNGKEWDSFLIPRISLIVLKSIHSNSK